VEVISECSRGGSSAHGANAWPVKFPNLAVFMAQTWNAIDGVAHLTSPYSRLRN
jgi:hypothetical protein